jgi:sugar lactone lactonase YvrE
MHRFTAFNSTSARSAGSLLRSIAAIALLAVACGASSPAWCKTASLWVADTDHNRVVELTPSDLESSGAPSPLVLDSAALIDPIGVAFDNSKNLWVTTDDNLVLEFTPAQLKNLATVSNPTPHGTISSTMFDDLYGCTFDKHGNLWVIDYGGDGVHELTHKQLKAGSNSDITPKINITSSSLDYPNFGVFDKSGNLWVSSEDTSSIVEFSASQLGSSGAETPHVILSSSGDSLYFPGQLVFDSKRNLWVANYETATVVMFEKNQLGVTGSPTPAVTLSGSAFDGPWGLALDSGGNLWVSNYTTDDIFKFSSTQLTTSGTPTPPVVLTGILDHGYQMTFGPVF